MAKAVDDNESKTDSFATQDEIMLGVLTAVDRNADTSQRTISRDLDIALGLANAYLKRCMRKGWIRIQQVPRRRYLYYLTPQGFAEKTRLTGQYLTSSFTFFRRAREQVSDLMAECAERNWNRIAFAGVSELAEVGTICAHDFEVEIVGVVDEERAGGAFCGLPVFENLLACGPVDAVIVTSLEDTAETFERMAQALGHERVFAPPLVRHVLPERGAAEQEKVG